MCILHSFHAQVAMRFFDQAVEQLITIDAKRPPQVSYVR